MSYVISGLPIETFRPLFGLSDEDLAARGLVATAGTPSIDGTYRLTELPLPAA